MGASVFFPRQGALDTARVDRQAELGLDRAGQGARPGGALAAHARIDERHHLRGELVRALRTARLREQPGYSLPGERGFGLVKGRAGEAEQRRGGSLLRSLETHLPEHLVFHLDEIVGVEKPMALEQGGAHSFRMPIQGALLLQALGLGVALLGQFGIPGSNNVSIHTPLSCRCQARLFGTQRNF